MVAASKCILALTDPPAGNDKYGPRTPASDVCRRYSRTVKVSSPYAGALHERARRPLFLSLVIFYMNCTCDQVDSSVYASVIKRRRNEWCLPRIWQIATNVKGVNARNDYRDIASARLMNLRSYVLERGATPI